MCSPHLIVLLLFLLESHSVFARVSQVYLDDLNAKLNTVSINKCCENNELMIDRSCKLPDKYNQSLWKPQFKDETGKNVYIKYYDFVNGLPNCGTTQMSAILELNGVDPKSEDELNLLTDGRLKHVIDHTPDAGRIRLFLRNTLYSLYDPVIVQHAKEPKFLIYNHNEYCLDKMFLTGTNITGTYGLVCVPEVMYNWRDGSLIMKKILNPLFHAFALVLYLLIAIIYFVLPTVRDLAGNIISTINVCLIVSQAADLVKIFTEFSNHVSFMIADVILYLSLLGAFFWLNSLGFYIWKTFKSRNVFLRVTDVRKYCYYSSVVWSSVVTMAVLALSAHFFLDMRPPLVNGQETIGWLGIAIFFTPIAFTILFNIFFYVTTRKVIRRIRAYGQIHHKLKGCFKLFVQMFLIMTTSWLFLLFSWVNVDGLLYAHIVVNMIQAILMFYVCVIRQARIMLLLRKCLGYAEPVPFGDWGAEMIHMNGGLH